MWQLDNRTPYAARQGWLRDADGAEVWVVAVKATYDLLPDGTTRVAAVQVPVNTGPVWREGEQELLYDTDLGPAKEATDVLLLGRAYAPRGRAVTELLIGFSLGPVRRAARVWGERRWTAGWLGRRPGPPRPFTVMPLTWDRAVGGRSDALSQATGNPAGSGLSGEDHEHLPNIEAVDRPLTSPSARPLAVGFGPIPVHWPARQQYAGTFDAAWQRQRRPLPPRDRDPRVWQIAPPEQQVPGHLRGGETGVLINLTDPALTPDGRLRFTLPKLSLGFETVFYDGSRETSRSRIHTVILEPDMPRLSVVHHMTLACHPKVNQLDQTRIIEKHRPLDRDRPLPADAWDPAQETGPTEGFDAVEDREAIS